MKFQLPDKFDRRIVEASPNFLVYPHRIAGCPRKPGVFLLSDAEDEIVYVGNALLLADAVTSLASQKRFPEATRLRWFRVDNGSHAQRLHAEWTKKYLAGVERAAS
jgi:excinuclease UvrABC nuclease subunit